MATKVFVSYSHADSEFAAQLSRMLGEIGVDWFLDEKDIQIGDSIELKIHEGLKSCTELVVVISPASTKSAWVSFEIGQAWALGKRIMPIVTHPALEIPEFIKKFRYAVSLSQVRDYFLHKNAHRAVILGAGTSGTRMLELLLNMNITVAGIYDKRPDANGLDLARERRVIPYSGATTLFPRLLNDCQKQPSVKFHFLLASEHAGFVDYVKRQWPASANCVLHCMGEDFPREFTEQDITKLLN